MYERINEKKIFKYHFPFKVADRSVPTTIRKAPLPKLFV
jgi:hypothetical protein